MTDTPVVEGVDTAVFTVPTDAPAADGALSWDTALVPAAVRCGDAPGIGYTCAPAATARVTDDLLHGVVKGSAVLDVPRMNGTVQRAMRNTGQPGVTVQAVSAAHAHAAAAAPKLRHPEWCDDHVRIERILFDGVLARDGGSITPGIDGAPGPGPTPGTERAPSCRVG
ncbi:hypothetical protein [Streptomyces sp. NPDC003710]